MKPKMKTTILLPCERMNNCVPVCVKQSFIFSVVQSTSAGLDKGCLVQYGSMRSEKPICAPPCLSGIPPNKGVLSETASSISSDGSVIRSSFHVLACSARAGGSHHLDFLGSGEREQLTRFLLLPPRSFCLVFPSNPCVSLACVSVASFLVSPWYDRNGWPGVKHQVTYLGSGLVAISLAGDGNTMGIKQSKYWPTVISVINISV